MDAALFRVRNSPVSTLSRVSLLAFLLTLAACDRAGEPSPGQQLDAAIARTQQAANDAKARTEALAAEARAKAQSSEPAMRQGYDSIKEAARAAGAAVSTSVEDASITATVSAGLAKDTELSASRIDVDTQNGVVVLNGPAPSAEAKGRATTIAGAVDGVRRVDNRLEIKTP